MTNKYEIDKFNEYQTILEKKVSVEDIEIFKLYLSYKKEVIEEYRNLIFGLPTLDKQTAEEIAHNYYYKFVRGIKIDHKNEGIEVTTLKHPPKVIFKNSNKEIRNNIIILGDGIGYLLDTVRYSKEWKIVNECYKIINPEYTLTNKIPFEDLFLPNEFKNLLYQNNDTFAGYLTPETPILLQLMIFFDCFKIAFDSEVDIMYYESFKEFYYNFAMCEYDIDDNVFYINPPYQANDTITTNNIKISKSDIVLIEE